MLQKLWGRKQDHQRSASVPLPRDDALSEHEQTDEDQQAEG
jgi:hypothetical protein